MMILLLFSAEAYPENSPKEDTSPPNVVLIYLDDSGYVYPDSPQQKPRPEDLFPVDKAMCEKFFSSLVMCVHLTLGFGCATVKDRTKCCRCPCDKDLTGWRTQFGLEPIFDNDRNLKCGSGKMSRSSLIQHLKSKPSCVLHWGIEKYLEYLEAHQSLHGRKSGYSQEKRSLRQQKSNPQDKKSVKATFDKALVTNANSFKPLSVLEGDPSKILDYLISNAPNTTDATPSVKPDPYWCITPSGLCEAPRPDFSKCSDTMPRGLPNTNKMCYVNAVLQCIATVSPVLHWDHFHDDAKGVTFNLSRALRWINGVYEVEGNGPLSDEEIANEVSAITQTIAKTFHHATRFSLRFVATRAIESCCGPWSALPGR